MIILLLILLLFIVLIPVSVILLKQKKNKNTNNEPPSSSPDEPPSSSPDEYNLVQKKSNDYIDNPNGTKDCFNKSKSYCKSKYCEDHYEPLQKDLEKCSKYNNSSLCEKNSKCKWNSSNCEPLKYNIGMCEYCNSDSQCKNYVDALGNISVKCNDGTCSWDDNISSINEC